MNAISMFEDSQHAMPRRQFLRNVSVPIALPLLGGAMPAFGQAADKVNPGPAAISSGRVIKNTIELHSDGSVKDNPGKDYFYACVRPDIIQPQSKILENKKDGTWIGTTAKRGERKLPDSLLWAISVEYEQPDGMSVGGLHPYVDISTIPQEHGHLKYAACSRETEGCDLSTTFQDHQKDWDYLQSKLRKILAAAGLSDRSSDWDKVAAIGNFCVQTRKTKSNGSRWVHPVDFCHHGAYCVGAANTMSGFCSLLGIPARTIGYGGHTTSEVLLDGKWRWVENTVQTVGKLKQPLQAVSFLDLLNDSSKLFPNVLKEAEGDQPEEARISKYCEFNCVYDPGRTPWFEVNHDAYTNWNFVGTNVLRYEPPRGTTGYGSLRELSALYPEQKAIRYKCDRSPKLWLTPFRMPSPGRKPEYITVDKDHGIRQEFFVPSGRPMKAIKSFMVIVMPEFKFWHYMPKDGGDWYYKVNEHKVYLRDVGGWNFKTNYEETGANGLELSIKPEWLL